MRQGVIHLHLDHFRIDHDEAELFRREPEDHAGDERVDANALAAAGRPRDEQVRHLRQIGDDRLAVNVLTQRERQFGFRTRFLPILRLEQLTQCHLHLARVRQLDADRVLAGNRREDVDSFRPRCPGEVALERHDLVHSHAFGRVNFVARDRRTFRDVAGRNCDTELPESVD